MTPSPVWTAQMPSQTSTTAMRAMSVERVTSPTSTLTQCRNEKNRIMIGTTSSGRRSHVPLRIPIARTVPTANTAACKPTNTSPAAYLVRNSRSRASGLESVSSIDPLETRSGIMLAVEMSARIVAPHPSQRLIPNHE